MKAKRKYLQFLVFPLLFFSCNNGTLPIYFENKSTEDINIEILVPANTGLKYNVNSLGLLQINYNPSNLRITQKYEDTVTNITLEYIYEAIQSNYDGFFSGAEESTDIEVRELLEPNNSIKSFNWERLKRISDSYNLDALFFVRNVKIDFEIITEIPFESNGYHTSELKCNSSYYYTIIYPDKKEFETLAVSYSDVFQDNTGFFGSIPAYIHSSEKIKEVIPYLSFETGKKAILEFFPTWHTVNRVYYGKATKELREAKKLINSGKWEEAITIWKENENSENAVLAKHCQFNLILAEEIMGSLEKAAQLAEEYYLKYHEGIAFNYKNILEDRLELKKKIRNPALR